METLGDLPDTLGLQRYMDFSKFVSLLDTEQIFLCRASKFEDQLEGSLTPLDAMLLNGDAMLLDIALNAWPSAKNLSADEMVEKQKRTNQLENEYQERTFPTVFGDINARDTSYEYLIQQHRDWVDVSCWHASNRESMAMWKIYGQSTNAVCIVTDVGSLKSSLNIPKEKQALLAEVQYISHAEDTFRIHHKLAPLMHKAHYYGFENEVRLMVYDPEAPILEQRDITEHGSLLGVELSRLIKEIRVAHNAPIWFHNLVRNIVAKYGLDVTVEQSHMSHDPIYRPF